VLRAVATVVVLLTLLVGLLWTFQRSLIYLPGDGPVGAAGIVLPGARDQTLTTDDGLHLAAWYLPAAAPDAATVLVANGNGGHRGLRAPLARALNAEGTVGPAVRLPRVRRQPGQSERSRPGPRRARRAGLPGGGRRGASGAPAVLRREPGRRSVTELATEHPPAGLVLRSPFVDLPSVGRVHYPFLPVGLLLRERHPVARDLATVRVPTTVVYGGRDTIVPPEQSRAVAGAAAQLHRVVEVPGADHNDPVLLDGPEVVGAVAELARAVG
jgi:fermentation-respiration switch protein FrsA (DUF1100 family)